MNRTQNKMRIAKLVGGRCGQLVGIFLLSISLLACGGETRLMTEAEVAMRRAEIDARQQEKMARAAARAAKKVERQAAQAERRAAKELAKQSRRQEASRTTGSDTPSMTPRSQASGFGASRFRETELRTASETRVSRPQRSVSASEPITMNAPPLERMEGQADDEWRPIEQELETLGNSASSQVQSSGRISASTRGEAAEEERKKGGKLRSMMGKLWPFGNKKTAADKQADEGMAAARRSSVAGHKLREDDEDKTVSREKMRARSPYRIEHRDGEVEMIGVLSVVSAASCVLPGGCGPELSLMEPNMKTRRAALFGNIDGRYDGRIIAVKGYASELTEAEENTPGFEDIDEALEVVQAKVVSDYPYFPYVSEAVNQYTQDEFGCQLNWDKSYSWYLDGKKPRYQVKMEDSLSMEAPRPSLRLRFDGKSQRVIAATLTPRDVNPCHR